MFPLGAHSALEPGFFLDDTKRVDALTGYRREAMKQASLTGLGRDEGYAARIHGFRGLLATGRTRKEALAELEDALADWIKLALQRGVGLPSVKPRESRTLTAA